MDQSKIEGLAKINILLPPIPCDIQFPFIDILFPTLIQLCSINCRILFTAIDSYEEQKTV